MSREAIALAASYVIRVFPASILLLVLLPFGGPKSVDRAPRGLSNPQPRRRAPGLHLQPMRRSPGLQLTSRRQAVTVATSAPAMWSQDGLAGCRAGRRARNAERVPHQSYLRPIRSNAE